MLDAVVELWVAGGFVMPPLFACTAVLWYALGWRVQSLRRGDARPLGMLLRVARGGGVLAGRGVVDGAVARVAHLPPGVSVSVLDELLDEPRRALQTGRVVVLSIVMVAPLLGLLGTVTGMIETFASLGEMKLFTQGGGVAGGIGEALLTTQMGLAVSIPGVIVGRLLDRRQAQLEDELAQLAELVRLGPMREAA